MEGRARIATVSAALFFGSLWGLAEATAGHALHVLRVPGLAGFLMFPLGFFLMSRAYARNGRPAAAFLASTVAASVKLIDLLIPGVDVMAVVNPAQAILLQGLAAAGLLYFMKTREIIIFEPPFSKKPGFVSKSIFLKTKLCGNKATGIGERAFPLKPVEAGMSLVPVPAALIIAAVVSALAWRAAYLALSVLWAALLHAPNILQAGSAPIFRFLILDSLANGVLIFILLKARSSFLNKNLESPEPLRLRLHPVASLACLAAAIVAEVAL